VRLGDELLHDGIVGLQFPEGPKANAEFPIGADGHFSGVLWEAGKHSASVRSSTLGGGPVILDSPELGDDPSVWDVRLPKRMIHGRVYDAETNEPLGNKEVSLRFSFNKVVGSMSFRTDDAGSYSYLALHDGSYDFSVQLPEYVPMSYTVEMKESDESKVVDFALSKGIVTTIALVSSDGRPLPGASVLEGVARDGHNAVNYFSTDVEGLLTLHVQKGESRTLYALPRQGSFAILKVTASDDGKMQRSVVPPPVGSLHILLKDSDGKQTHGNVVMRFNGEWLPAPAVMRLPHSWEPDGPTISGLPAGLYELWAVPVGGTILQQAAETTAPPNRAPVRVGLSGGVEDVTLVVQPRD
jgi:hypothetical protein